MTADGLVAATMQVRAAGLHASTHGTTLAALANTHYLNLTVNSGTSVVTIGGTPGELLDLANRITGAVVPLIEDVEG